MTASKDDGMSLSEEARTRTLEWARRFAADCAAPGSTPPLHVSGDAMLDVCRALLSSSAAASGVVGALEKALQSMKAMRGVIEEAPAETWGVDGEGGEEAHLQRWWPKQAEHLHYIDKDIAEVEAALSSSRSAGK